MDLPPCFPKVNGKAACWKIEDGEGGGGVELALEAFTRNNKR